MKLNKKFIKGDFLMKKILVVIAIIFSIMFLTHEKQEYYIIPNDAIRFRVIANSNSVFDQLVKKNVTNKLQDKFLDTLVGLSNKEEVKDVIQNDISSYEKIVEDELNLEGVNYSYSINYGMNYFPEKVYKGLKYKAGNYESLVVTLGEGNGNNFWCLLFPPVCLMEVEDKKTTDVEYTFFIKELFNKYFK